MNRASCLSTLGRTSATNGSRCSTPTMRRRPVPVKAVFTATASDHQDFLDAVARRIRRLCARRPNSRLSPTSRRPVAVKTRRLP